MYTYSVETWKVFPLKVHPMESVKAAFPRDAPLPLLVWKLTSLLQPMVSFVSPT